MTKEQFIEEVAKYAEKYAKQFGIKIISPVIAQACCESGYGTSDKCIEGRHNYFGMKYKPNRVTCSNGIYTSESKEQNPDGSWITKTFDWFTFPTLEAGVLGYFQFINIANYSSLKGVTDPEQYLKNIKAAGYASDHNYVLKAMKVLNDNDLTRFDTVQPSTEQKSQGVIVAIDAGHGSNTAGKRTPDGYREHWINVACASFCDTALKRCGIKTVRVAWDDTNAKDDEDMALTARQKIIKTNNCRVSVSFHANAYSNGWNDAQGVETLISNKYPADSLTLAKLAQAYLIQSTPQKNRGVKTQALAMCNCNAMGTKAAILVEIGFMTNKAEADLMKTDKFCKEQAEEVAHAICDYVGAKYIQPTDSVINEIVQEVQNTPKPSGSYLVKINTDSLNVRAGAGTQYPVNTNVKRGQVYTIVDESDGWGKLKSGAGWIKLKYTIKV